MTSRSSLLLPLPLLLLLVPLGVACSNADTSSSSEDSDLIGGREGRADELPATMVIKDNCTVAKVGPNMILTAAHCVTGGSAYKFAAGVTIQISAAKGIGSYAPAADPDAAPAEAGAIPTRPWRNFVVEKVEVEPAWRDKCSSASITCGSVHIAGRTDMADVAVVFTTEELTGIPEAAIDLAPVAPSDRVAITGYGCEQAVGGSWDYSNRRLRVAETEAVPFERTIHTGSFIFPEDRDTGLLSTMDGIYVITPGPQDAPAPPPATDGGDAGDAGEAVDAAVATPDAGGLDGRGGLCPGDSGGPLYRLGLETPVIVGVNANYTFSTGTTYPLESRSYMYGGSPVTNWHTRLDGLTGRKVGAWLKGLGVRTACSRGTCE